MAERTRKGAADYNQTQTEESAAARSRNVRVRLRPQEVARPGKGGAGRATREQRELRKRLRRAVAESNKGPVSRTAAGSQSELRQRLRKSVLKAEEKQVNAATKAQALEVHRMVWNAASLGTTRYLPQGPEHLTKSMFQSPAEREYARARSTALKYGDKRLAAAVCTAVSEHLYSIGEFESSLEWLKISGDHEKIRSVGSEIAKELEKRGDYYVIGFRENELGMKKVGRAAEIAKECGNIELAKEILTKAVRKYEVYGESCAQKPFMGFIGFEFGHLRAIRFAMASGDKALANKVWDDAVELYKDRISINVFTLAFAYAIGDSMQVELIRDILKRRNETRQESRRMRNSRN